MTGSMNQMNKGEVEIDLLQIFRALIRKLWLIVLVAAICAAIGFFGTLFLITPKYSTTFTAYINNHNSNELLTSIANSDLTARSTLANTAAKIATSVTVLDNVAVLTGVDPKAITISTSVDSTSGILTVRTVMADRSKVLECANNLAGVLTEETTRIIEGSSMQIIDSPREPEGRYSPSYSRNAVLAALIGVILIAIVIIIMELRDDTLKDASELEERYGIPVVGSIPDMSAAGRKNAYKYGYGGK